MKISYNWLIEYLPIDEKFVKITGNPKKIAEILTSVGLEVESLEKYEEVKNGLEGLLIGEVLGCEKHPDADKLKVTTVSNGHGETLQIVCGAPNVAIGQKVVLAPAGAKLFPVTGEPIVIKKAKIRGIESNGMLCAEDEIGLGSSHAGIMVLPEDAKAGMAANAYFNLYNDWIFTIGITPNRMDAMSHLGVAKDVCAYISHHYKKSTKVISPFKNNFKADNHTMPVEVVVKDQADCERYAGVSIAGIKVAPSPDWLQHKLKSIGLRPVNNIVDITNFILHETGQPLHAFDLDKIKPGQSGAARVIVEKLPQGTPFITLDGKERILSGDDIMICDGSDEPMCIAGVFGGLESGVSAGTQNVFLEAAVFNPGSIRKSMLLHNLRTEAAVRFEKGVDVSNTVNVLKRAAMLIRQVAGGKIASEIVDIYPVPRDKKEVTLSYHYLKKLSGKNYHPDTIRDILASLNFVVGREGIDSIKVEVPFTNPDISLPADIVEEIMRIDGLDNIEIPATINMAPAIDPGLRSALQKEKVASWLTGIGFHEIFTNSITNSKYFTEEQLQTTVKIINSLSEGLDVMRPTMLPTGLECIAYNLNRRNESLLFFEFGKTYSHTKTGYHEQQNLALYLSGHSHAGGWNTKSKVTDIYFAKGVCQALLSLLGLQCTFEQAGNVETRIGISVNKAHVGIVETVDKNELASFSIKQPVFFASMNWDVLLSIAQGDNIAFQPVSRFPAIERDLSMVVDKSVEYGEIEKLVKSLQIKRLTKLALFDVFENEKLGANKKSLAVNFTFLDHEKTMTDAEIETMMNKIISNLENKSGAVIRNA